MLHPNVKIVGASGFFGSFLSLNAAFITWNNSTTPIDDNGDFVDTTGTLIAAINSDTLGEDSMISSVNFIGHDMDSWNSGIEGVGGVTITSDAQRGNFGDTFVEGAGSPPGITDNTPLDNLISSGIWNPQTVTLTGLTIGDTYIIQIIGNDSRDGRGINSDFVTILTDGVNDVNGGTVGINPLSDTAPGAEGTGTLAGHAIVGVFVADEETQSFSLFGSTDGGVTTNSGGRAQINGFQLRTLVDNDDSDGDGMSDAYELANGLDINDASDANIDSDGDGISNIDEFNNEPQLLAGNADADNDGLNDGEEVDGLVNTFGDPVTNLLTDGTSIGAATDPFSADSDDDGIDDLDEIQGSDNSFNNAPTDPNNEDTDGDELTDGIEIGAELDPNDATGDNGAEGDPDSDQVSNAEELEAGTNLFLADSDEDGANDRVEIDIEGLDPLNPDTDNDKILDGEELIAGEDGFITNPLAFDSDEDGVPDAFEAIEGVDPSEATGADITPNYATIRWVAESFDDYQLSDGTEVFGVGLTGIQSGGTLLFAENFQGEDLTINEIPFTGITTQDVPRCSANVLTLLTESTGSVASLYTGAVTELDPLLDTVWFNPADNPIPHILITGLTVGETYFIQLGTSEDRAGREGRYAVLDGFFGGNDASVNVGAANTIFGGEENPALLFTGTFTATLPTQMFTLQAFDGDGNTDEDQVFMTFVQVRAGVPTFSNPGVIGIVSTGFDENGNFVIELASDATGAIVSESPDLETAFTPLTNGVSILGNVITISGAVIDENGDNSSYFRVSQ